MQIGGVIYGDAADKAARFVMQCNQKRIPLIFFQDATGFMVGYLLPAGSSTSTLRTLPISPLRMTWAICR